MNQTRLTVQATIEGLHVLEGQHQHNLYIWFQMSDPRVNGQEEGESDNHVHSEPEKAVSFDKVTSARLYCPTNSANWARQQVSFAKPFARRRVPPVPVRPATRVGCEPPSASVTSLCAPRRAGRPSCASSVTVACRQQLLVYGPRG